MSRFFGGLMKIGVIILARTNFGRWPDKILYELEGKPIFEWVIIKAKTLGIPVIVSTTANIEDQIIVDTAEHLGAIVSIGNPDDRNERHAQAIIENRLDYILPVSPVWPFFDIEYTKKLISKLISYPGFESYSIGTPTQAVPHAIKAQQIIDNLDNPDRGQEIFTNFKLSTHKLVYEYDNPKVRSRYLFNYNIAFKYQAEIHKAICDYIGHFPKNHDELRNALLKMDVKITGGIE